MAKKAKSAKLYGNRLKPNRTKLAKTSEMTKKSKRQRPPK